MRYVMFQWHNTSRMTKILTHCRQSTRIMISKHKIRKIDTSESYRKKCIHSKQFSTAFVCVIAKHDKT